MGMPLETPAAATDTLRPKLLVVDDQPINIHVIYQAFANDHQVFMATSGAQALQLCRLHLPDMVLLDVVMPDMDGNEVCRQLKADPLTRDIPVIFVTAQGDAAQETQGLELGAVDFIVKPINADVVRARVRSHLGFARSNALLAATLEATAEGVLVTNQAGGISSMNRNFIKMWNIPQELVVHGAHTSILAFIREQIVSGPGCDPDANPLPAPADPIRAIEPLELTRDRYFERQAMPLHINASLSGMVFSFRDVTERRRATRALQQLNETLETRILERTRDLELAVRQADAANRAKSLFLSNMSHEIRTPMNGVIGMAYLGLRGNPDSRQREYLEKIHSSGQHLLGIINDILDFSKVEAGKLELEVLDLSIPELFENLASQMAHAAQAKGLNLVFELDPALSRPFRGDPLRVTQILLNFIGNAIKFTESGEVVVRAANLHRGKGESLIQLEVQDSGIGMTELQAGQLFQSFQQADASTTRQYGGTGLGLAINKQLALLMGGEVGVSSQPGRGSTFWLRASLPWSMAKPLNTAMAEPSASPTAPPSEQWPTLRGARVLLVEDNLLNQEVAAGLLQDVAITVRAANNGQEALDWLERESFDCVLMDVQMPVMDGLTATRRIRANPRTAGQRVVAMTANARAEDRGNCLKAGMDDFVTKPVVPGHLYGLLAKWLESRAVPSPATPPAPAAPLSDAPAGSPLALALLAGNPDIVDLSILVRSVGGKVEKVRRFAAMFVEAIPEGLAELEDALAKGDLQVLADLGHRMKSSSKMVGAMGLAALCQSLEEFRSHGTVEQAREAVAKVAKMFEAVAEDIGKALA